MEIRKDEIEIKKEEVKLKQKEIEYQISNKKEEIKFAKMKMANEMMAAGKSLAEIKEFFELFN